MVAFSKREAVVLSLGLLEIAALVAWMTYGVIVNVKPVNPLGFIGCSSHSGRRSFITQAARNGIIGWGSLRDVQALAGHASLTTTSRYIEVDAEAQSKLVNIV